jgi:hypothetical protein
VGLERAELDNFRELQRFLETETGIDYRIAKFLRRLCGCNKPITNQIVIGSGNARTTHPIGN